MVRRDPLAGCTNRPLRQGFSIQLYPASGAFNGYTDRISGALSFGWILSSTARASSSGWAIGLDYGTAFAQPFGSIVWDGFGYAQGRFSPTTVRCVRDCSAE